MQEFFGIAVMEAAYCGARPLLPRRLAYPELYPPACLYERDEDFAGALRALIAAGAPPAAAADAERGRLRGLFDVRASVAALDDLIAAAATARRRSPGRPPCG